MNYNRLALQGVDIDDMDFIKHFNLPSHLAYTPKLNDVILDTIFKQNLEGFKRQGMSDTAAGHKAGELRSKARKEIQALLKNK